MVYVGYTDNLMFVQYETHLYMLRIRQSIINLVYQACCNSFIVK